MSKPVICEILGGGAVKGVGRICSHFHKALEQKSYKTMVHYAAQEACRSRPLASEAAPSRPKPTRAGLGRPCRQIKTPPLFPQGLPCLQNVLANVAEITRLISSLC